MSQAVLKLRDVAVVRYGTTAIDDVDWDVHTGERWIVLGPNGSGKTTLLEVASTYRYPTRGHVEVLGEVFGDTDVRRLRPRIGYASVALERKMARRQTALTTVVTGKDALLQIWRERYAASDYEHARALLTQLGVEHLAERYAETLSEGERRRVHLARTLMADPDLWLLDEPTAGLDLGAREGLLVSLSELARRPRPLATVFVTHHVEEIPSNFTHLALVRGGRIMSTGPLEEVLTSEALSECFEVALHVERRHDRWWARAASARHST